MKTKHLEEVVIKMSVSEFEFMMTAPSTLGDNMAANKQPWPNVTKKDVCIWVQDSDGPWCTSCGKV